MTISAPPVGDALIDDEGLITLSWLLFMNGLFEGDTGVGGSGAGGWTPNFQSLTQTGAPTVTGRYYRIIRRICYFSVLIVPATNTSAIAGTTYIDNFPLTFTADGPCFAVSGNLGDGPGHIVAGNNRIYVPGWTNVSVPLTIIGIGEVSS